MNWTEDALWALAPPLPNLTTVGFGKGVWVGGTDTGEFHFSSDGRRWSPTNTNPSPAPVPGDVLSGAYYSNGYYVICCWGGYGSDTKVIYYTQNPTVEEQWNSFTFANLDPISVVHSAYPVWVFSGDILDHPAIVTMTTLSGAGEAAPLILDGSLGMPDHLNGVFSSITYGEPSGIPAFVAVGTGCDVAPPNTTYAIIYSAQDPTIVGGAGWTQRLKVARGTGNKVFSVTWNGHAFCMVGGETPPNIATPPMVYTSIDGITWVDAVRTQYGTGGTIAAPIAAPNMTFEKVAVTFTNADVGRRITISGSAGGTNDGTFLITSLVSATKIGYYNDNGVAAVLPVAAEWTISKQFSGISHLLTGTKGRIDDLGLTLIVGSGDELSVGGGSGLYLSEIWANYGDLSRPWIRCTLPVHTNILGGLDYLICVGVDDQGKWVSGYYDGGGVLSSLASRRG